MKSNKAHIETRGTSNEAVLEGDPKYTNLIKAIMHGKNPVKYTSMVSEELKWFIKEKECFNVETVKV